MDPPQLIYAPIAGRAELIRLIAAAGNLPINELSNMANFGKPSISETGESKRDYTSPSGMPLLSHGGLKMSQSGPIETYVAAIAPRYRDLTVQQRAVDNMYQGIKEEILLSCAKAIFTTRKTDEGQAKKDVAELLDKWFTIFEERVPATGFIQGLGFPTPADLALLNIAVGFMPFGAAKKLADYDLDKWAKVKALCDRCAADPGVAAYLKSSEYTAANPFGF
uniref:Glutathione S-transferase n=1 Tax=Alexandrium catenella TaxID=2925 RepID=A0A7S1W3E7_ALECA